MVPKSGDSTSCVQCRAVRDSGYGRNAFEHRGLQWFSVCDQLSRQQCGARNFIRVSCSCVGGRSQNGSLTRSSSDDGHLGANRTDSNSATRHFRCPFVADKSRECSDHVSSVSGICGDGGICFFRGQCVWGALRFDRRDVLHRYVGAGGDQLRLCRYSNDRRRGVGVFGEKYGHNFNFCAAYGESAFKFAKFCEVILVAKSRQCADHVSREKIGGEWKWLRGYFHRQLQCCSECSERFLYR